MRIDYTGVKHPRISTLTVSSDCRAIVMVYLYQRIRMIGVSR